jgi:hypothetical protein
MSVELRQHVGVMTCANGQTEEVKFDQDFVLFKGEFVGYWPHRDHSPILLVRDVPRHEYSGLAQACADLRKVAELPLINDQYRQLIEKISSQQQDEDEDDD